MHQNHRFSFIECIVYSLHADKRRWFLFSFLFPFVHESECRFLFNFVCKRVKESLQSFRTACSHSFPSVR